MTQKSLIQGAGFLLLVFVAAFAGVYAGMKFREARSPAPPPVPPSILQAGTAFPGTPVATPAGETADTADLVEAGGVVMFLRLDCQPCGTLVARWQELVEDGELAGVRAVGITADDPAQVEPYREEKGLGFPIYVDPQGTFIRDWKVQAVPLVVVVEPGGAIARTFSMPTEIDPERLRREVGAA